MKPIKRYRKTLLACLLPATLIMSGCADDDDDPAMSAYTIKITNVTNAQPLTPVAVVLHKAGYVAWGIGTAATTGLEKLAEGGDTTDFITEAKADANVLMTDQAGSGAFLPGTSVSVDMTLASDDEMLLTLASMLAKTNDAFAGSQQVDIGSMNVGDSKTIYSHVHDSGTELNTESAGTMPAVSSGEGFNGARDDINDFVTLHSGVVTMDDGLSTSVLDESHRWLDAAARIDITRMK